MSANLKTTELLDEIKALIDAASMSFTPKLIQAGDLGFYPVQIASLTSDLPAIFMKIERVRLELADVTGEVLEFEMDVRLVLWDSWAMGDNVYEKRVQRIQEIVESIIQSAGSTWDPGVSGLDFSRILPTGFEPESTEQFQYEDDNQVYTAAATLTVAGRTSRA